MKNILFCPKCGGYGITEEEFHFYYSYMSCFRCGKFKRRFNITERITYSNISIFE